MVPRAGALDALERARAVYNRGDISRAIHLADQLLADIPDFGEALGFRASLLLKAGRYQEATEALDKALESLPDHPHLLSNRAIALKKLGKLEDAESSIRRSLAASPRNPNALANYGSILNALGRHREAIAQLDRALALAPRHAAARCNRANSRIAVEDFAAALHDADDAIRIESNFPEAHINRGLALQGLDRPEDALQAFLTAARLAPTNAVPLQHLGTLSEVAGRPDEAIGYYSKALALEPRNAATLERLARLHEAQRRFEEALAYYDQLLTSVEPKADLIVRKARCLRLSGDAAASIECLDQGLDQGLDSSAIAFNKGLALLELRDYDRALECFDRCRRMEPGKSEYACSAAIALFETGDTERAEAVLNDFLRENADDVRCLLALGRILVRKTRHAEAIQHFDRAIELAPEEPEGHLEKALAHSAMGERDRGIADLVGLSKTKPDCAPLFFVLGRLYSASLEYSKARDCFHRAVELDPAKVEYLEKWAHACLDDDQYEMAIVAARQAIELNPKRAFALNVLGTAQLQLDQLADAIVSYERALALEPDNAQALANLGSALRQSRRFEEAEEALRHAVQLAPESADHLRNLSVVLNDRGKWGESLDLLNRAVELDPNNIEAFFGRSLLILLLGNFGQGFPEYEWRKKRKQASGNRQLPAPLWLGDEDLAGKRIFIHWEQGFGDTIQMCRYARKLAEMGAIVLFSPQKKLLRLMKSLGSRITLIDESETPSLVCDYHSPLMSLPYAFQTKSEDEIVRYDAYLDAEKDRISHWSSVIGSYGFKVGICWQGGVSAIDFGRSFELIQFRRISQIEGVRLISLQKGDAVAQLEDIPGDMKVEHLGPEFDAGQDAFIDTAAVMRACDLVISSDTSVAHLAGALGVPTWIPLKFNPDWRFMLNRPDSPWYPSFRLFRQKQWGDWRSPFEDMEKLLRAMIRDSAYRSAS